MDDPFWIVPVVLSFGFVVLGIAFTYRWLEDAKDERARRALMDEVRREKRRTHALGGDAVAKVERQAVAALDELDELGFDTSDERASLEAIYDGLLARSARRERLAGRVQAADAILSGVGGDDDPDVEAVREKRDADRAELAALQVADERDHQELRRRNIELRRRVADSASRIEAARFLAENDDS